MEKVRRYANGRIEEFDRYFKGQAQELNGVSAELETRQNTATAAVKRLENYESVMNELLEMTARAEENLEVLKNETRIIDDLKGQLEEQKRLVDSIEKKLPQINDKFTDSNQKHLQMIATELLNQYNTRAEQIDTATKAAADRTDKVLAKIEADIQSAYTNAAKKAENLEDAAFKNLSAQAQDRADAYQRDMAGKLRELETQRRSRCASWRTQSVPQE